MKTSALALSLMFISCADSRAVHESPRSVVTAFGQARLSSPTGSGLLHKPELEALREYLSANLFTRYSRAIECQQNWIRRNPDDPARRIFNKPPCVEGGDYFESLYEWPDVRSNQGEHPEKSFRVQKVETLPNTISRVHVEVRYDTTPPLAWTDVYVVTQEEGRFVIDDVVYSGIGPTRSGRLSEILEDCSTD